MKISVVTPSYNQAEFIQRTVDSVLSQTGGFEIEYLVIDGQSTDGSLEILKEYGQSIRLVSEPDRGQVDAINKGLAMATGDIVCWLNSDDVFLENCLRRVVELFESEPNTQWLYGKVRIINAKDHEIRRLITAYKNFRMSRFSYSRLIQECWISQMGVFWRRDFGTQIGHSTEAEILVRLRFLVAVRQKVTWAFCSRLLGRFSVARSIQDQQQLCRPDAGVA